MKKVEELKNEALRIKYTFYGGGSDILSIFVDSYAEVLMGLYQYTVLMNTMRELQEKMPKKDITEVAKDVNEINHRESLYSKFENLSKVYGEIRSKDILKI